MNPIPHPVIRPRRLRQSPSMRAMVRENHLLPTDFILPLFIEEEISEPVPISAMPGVMRHTENSFIGVLKEAYGLGIPACILFGVSHHKDDTGSDSLRPNGLLDRMIKRAKDSLPDMVIIADACFCEYTSHGHCGPVAHGDVDNDATLDILAQQAVTAARAGADIIAPSSMMDGMVAAIRAALDGESFTNTAIMSYAAKYASCFYGPFREAAGCALGKGKDAAHYPKDRKSYQMDPANSNEAMREVELDIAEGADMVMVKPGMPYLDILRRVKDRFEIPTFVYQVSGEYAMIKAAAQNGWLDETAAFTESLMAFKRAGADGIITYAAIDVAKTL